MKELLFWQKIIPVFKENFSDHKKNRSMPWPQNDQEVQVLASFFLQHANNIDSGKEIYYRKEQKIGQTNKTFFISFASPKEWFILKNISLIFQGNLPPLCPTALKEICTFKRLQNLNLNGNLKTLFIQQNELSLEEGTNLELKLKEKIETKMHTVFVTYN